jgi:excisionase family DNA binding protein
MNYRTPPEVAKVLRVEAKKVSGWCASGQLRAVNVSNGHRPRWRIPDDALAEFLAGRTSRPMVKPSRRKRAANVIKFF